jgi:hypothetical protein
VISAAAAWLLAVAGVQAQGLALPDPTRWQTTLAPRSAAVQGVQYAAAAQEGEGLVYPKMPTILKTAGQMARPGGKTAEDDIDFAIRTELPDPGELFKRDSERQLFERIRQEARKRPGSGRINFPSEPIIGKGPYQQRRFQPIVEPVEPNYVCHRQLYFEQPNFERNTWSLGAIQPAVHLLVFYYDMVMLPYHMWERPCQDFDCNAGKCLPGDPCPMYLYRERFSLSGLAASTATFWGGAFIFP